MNEISPFCLIISLSSANLKRCQNPNVFIIDHQKKLDVLSCLPCSRASRALCSTCSHVSHASCPTRHRVSRTSYQTFSTVKHYDKQPLLKECYYIDFFIRDINLQDPLIYVNFTTLIHQPAFIRKPAL